MSGIYKLSHSGHMKNSTPIGQEVVKNGLKRNNSVTK